jgi:hypothetical protein
MEGYANAEEGVAQRASLDAEATGIEDRAHQRVSQSQMDELVGSLKDLLKSFQRAKASLLDTQDDVQSTNNLLIASLGR